MEHFLSAIVVAIACIISYWFSWRAMKRGEYRAALFIVMVTGLGLRLFLASDPYIHLWDERFHALVAKHLTDNFLLPTLYDNAILPYDYTNWKANHIWVHKQPMSLWLIAISVKILGANEIAVRLPTILLSTVAMWLVYDIGRYLYDKKTGYISALLFSFNGVILILCAGRMPTEHPEHNFMFFILLSVWFAVRYVEKGKFFFNILCGVALGCAVLTKWLPAYVVLPIWTLLTLKAHKNNYRKIVIGLFVVIITSVVVFLPWQLYILDAFPKEAAWEYQYNTMHMFHALEEHSGNWTFHFWYAREIYGYLVYIPLGWFFVHIARNRTTSNLVILTWFVIPYTFFTIAATKMPAYPIFAAPAIFMVIARCFIFLSEKARQHRYKAVLQYLPILIIVASAKFTQGAIRTRATEPEQTWAREIKKLKGTQYDSEKYILFNVEHSIEAMFYLNSTAYPHTPDETTVNKLRAEGYEVAIFEKGKL